VAGGTPRAGGRDAGAAYHLGMVDTTYQKWFINVYKVGFSTLKMI
jgi:hypothetical protein